MIAKKKKCDGECGQEAYIWKSSKTEGKKYCKNCYLKHKNRCVQDKASTKPTKKQYRIPSKSSKKAKLDIAYSILREQYMKGKPLCEAHLPNICTKVSTDIHHKAGRGIFQNDTTTWLSVCRSCHNWIEMNSDAAKEMGLSINRIQSV